MNADKYLTKEKADALLEHIGQKLERENIKSSAKVIACAISEAWRAGFQEGQKHPLDWNEA